MLLIRREKGKGYITMQKQIFILNEHTYVAKEFDFNMMCDLEESGVSLEEMERKPMSFIRNYISMCIGRDKEFAGKEIEGHIINGGTFDDIMSVMTAEMEKSDFFRSISKTEEEDSTESQKPSRKKASKTTEA